MVCQQIVAGGDFALRQIVIVQRQLHKRGIQHNVPVGREKYKLAGSAVCTLQILQAAVAELGVRQLQITLQDRRNDLSLKVLYRVAAAY